MPEKKLSTPYNNFFSGDGKSHVYEGPAYYVPSERGNWIKQHDYRSLPRETKRDAIDVQSEDQWVEFMRQRDTPSGNVDACTTRSTALYYHPPIVLYS